MALDEDNHACMVGLSAIFSNFAAVKGPRINLALKNGNKKTVI